MTIRETAKTGICSEKYLRRLVHEGRCPGIYTGRVFRVDIEALEEMLKAESRACMTQHPDEKS